MAADHTPPLQVGSFSLNSRLVVGTGKYETYEVMQDALAASGCDTVTVAVRRERLLDDQGARCSTSSTSTGTPSFPIPPVASRPKMPCERLAWDENCSTNWATPVKTGSFSRSWPTRRPCFPTPSAHWKPPKNWSPMGSPCWSTRATILSWPAIFGMPAPPA